MGKKSNKRSKFSLWICPECGEVEAQGANNWELEQYHNIEAHGGQTLAAQWLDKESLLEEEAIYFEAIEEEAEAKVAVVAEAVKEAKQNLTKFEVQPLYECDKCDFTTYNKSGLLSHLRAHDRKAKNPEQASPAELRSLLHELVSSNIEDLNKAEEQEVADKAFFDEVNIVEGEINALQKALARMQSLSPGQRELLKTKINKTENILAKVEARLVDLTTDPRYIRGESAASLITERLALDAQEQAVLQHNADAKQAVIDYAREWQQSEVNRFTSMLHGELQIPSKKFGKISFGTDCWLWLQQWAGEDKLTNGQRDWETLNGYIPELFDFLMARYCFMEKKVFTRKLRLQFVNNKGAIETRVEEFSYNVELPFTSWEFAVTDMLKIVHKNIWKKGQLVDGKWVHERPEPTLEKHGYLNISAEELLDMSQIHWDGKKTGRVYVPQTKMEVALVNAGVVVRDDPRAEQVQI